MNNKIIMNKNDQINVSMPQGKINKLQNIFNTIALMMPNCTRLGAQIICR